MTIVDRQLLGHTQRHAARNDGYFVKWIRAFNHRGNHRMTGLVIGRDSLFMLADDERFARNTHQHLILSAFEVFVRDRLLIHARCNQDNAFVGFKAVHLDKQLVQCLLALVMSAAEACAAMPSDCVDFIYKEDARGVLLALLEQIANARGTHADEHFNEIRSADREERNIGLACDCAREKCFSGTRGAEQQYTSRNPSAKLLELLGFL